jgi:phosphoserine phosphatase
MNNHFVYKSSVKDTNKTKSLFLTVLCLLAFSTGLSAQPTRTDLAKIRVSKEGNFKYWNSNSPALQQLKAFVADVTDENSDKFVPACDRIATFDVDGTLLCETAPTYFNWLLYIHRFLYDDTFTPTEEQLSFAKDIEDYVMNQKPMPEGWGDRQQEEQAMGFVGLTQKEVEDYVTHFIETEPVWNYSNLTWGTALFWPMIEAVSYLVANDFKVFICSGVDRDVCHAIIKDIYDIPRYQVLASDVYYLPESLLKEMDYKGAPFFESYSFDQLKGQRVVRGTFKNLCTSFNKVDAITRELAQKPILAWGNSTGDFPMFEFVTVDNPYPSIAFCLLCDDTEREFGNPSKAERCKTACEQNGWIGVSMHDEWATIYGSEVQRQIATTVNTVNTNATQEPIYNLQGQRITTPYRGVNIQNGRKYLSR